MGYVLLAVAIVLEVIGTSALKASEGFTRLWPSLLVVFGYGGAFYCLSEIMKVLPVGLTYGVWSAAGIVLVALVAWLLYGQQPDLPAVIGMGLIVLGVIVLTVFSKMPT